MAIKSPMQLHKLCKKLRKDYEAKDSKHKFSSTQDLTHKRICTALQELHKYTDIQTPTHTDSENFEKDQKVIVTQLVKFNKEFKDTNKSSLKGKFWVACCKVTTIVKKLAIDDLDASEDEANLNELDNVVPTEDEDQPPQQNAPPIPPKPSSWQSSKKPSDNVNQQDSPKPTFAQKRTPPKIPYPTVEQLQKTLQQVATMPRDFAQIEAYKRYQALLQTQRKKANEDNEFDQQKKGEFLLALDGLERQVKGQLMALGSKEELDQDTDPQTLGERSQREFQAQSNIAEGENNAFLRQRHKFEGIQRRKAKAEQTKKDTLLCETAKNSLDILANTPHLTLDNAEYLKGLSKKTFGSDKLLKALGDVLHEHATLRNDPNAKKEDVDKAWKKVGEYARAYKVWAEKEHSKEIAKKSGDTYTRYATAMLVLDNYATIANNEMQMQQSVRELSKNILESIKASNTLAQKGMGSLSSVNAGSVRQLEELTQHPGLPSDLKQMATTIINKAKEKLKEEADFRFRELPEQTMESRAELLLEYGGCKPPSEKGQSDSFRIMGTDGKPAYFFKPTKGEANPGPGWSMGGGAPREILLSKLNEQLSKDFGLDFKVPGTELGILEDESFSEGTINKETKRAGALVSSVPLQDGDPPNIASWFENSELDKDVMMQSLNKKDCKNIALLNLLTLDVDANAGNVMAVGTGQGPGQTRLVPIDAGRKLPSPRVFKNAPTAMASQLPYTPGRVNLFDNFITQTPGCQEPFDNDQKQSILAMDPKKIVSDMKSSYSDIVRKAPEMANTIDPGSFELVGKSISFLQAAVQEDPPLSIYEVSQIYASGFGPIVDATDNTLAGTINQVLLDFKTVKDAGGDQKIQERGFNPASLTLQDKARILNQNMDKAAFEQDHYARLQTYLADIANFIGESSDVITNQLTLPFDAQNYNYLKQLELYKNRGGDPVFKQMFEGNLESYQMDVVKPIPEKNNWPWKIAVEMVKLGGFPEFIKLVGKDKFDREYRGKSVEQLEVDFRKEIENKK